MSNTYVAVSTDPIKSYEEIVEYAKEMQDKADLLHCDVMDGKFVQSKTYDWAMVENLNQNTALMLDVHLMVDEPLQQIENYIKAGANIITLHYEAFKKQEDLVKAINLVKSMKTLVGLSIKPETSFKEIRLFCYNIDVLLVMSVEPGKSGQKFLNNTFEKVKEIAKFRHDNNLNFKIEVDGGVNGDNAKGLREAGVDILVSGSYVFGATDRKKAIENLKKN